MNKTINGKDRIFYLDEIRALAIILVILCHVVREFCQLRISGTFEWSSIAFLIDFGVMGVPLFLMISGSLLLNRDYELEDFFRRRFSRILIPFIFWVLILPAFKIVTYPLDSSSYLSIIVGPQYWFVWVLIGVYLFLPIINVFVREYQMKGVEFFLLIWFITLILNTFGHYPFHELELSYFAGYVGYVVLGYYLSNKEFKMSDNRMICIGFILLVVFTIININFTLTQSQMGVMKNGALDYYHYKTLVVALQSTGLFLIFEYFAKYCFKHSDTIKNKIYSFFKDGSISKIIYSLSVCSYGMYLIHFFFVYGLRWVDVHLFPTYSGNAIINFPVILISVICLSWLSVYTLSKIPYLKEISGAH